MKCYGEVKNAAGKGFIYENKKTSERVISAKPNARGLPGKPEDWEYVGRES